MLLHSAMWALWCAAASVVCVYEPAAPVSAAPDTAADSVQPQLLNEFVVTAPPVINRTDRKVLRPDRATVSASSNGIDLLRKLRPARIVINPMTDEITLAGGEPVVLCIDGVESSSAQISALRPEDVVRIEYHDSPGVRYAGACAVIDYITGRHDSGGSLQADAFGAFASGRYATIDHLAGRYNSGPSVWSVNVGYMGQRKDKWIRDYREVWHYPDADVNRTETGLPVKVGSAGMESAVNYNYLNPRGDMLNLRLGLDLTDVPDMEQGDRRAVLETSGSDIPVIVTEHTEEHSVRPLAGAYYLRQLGPGRNLTLDLQAYCIHSATLHEYAENGVGQISRVNGNKYAAKFSGIYENRSGARVWSAGISNNSSVIRNVYRQPDDAVKVTVVRTQSALCGEYSDRFGNWGVMLDVRAVYNHLRQENRVIGGVFLQPAVNISYRPADRYFLRYSAAVDHIMPGASEISAAATPVQTGMIRRGNPALEPFRVVDQRFTFSSSGRYVSAEAMVEYRSEHRPIMESVIFENGEFVRTYFNQRSFRRLRAAVTLTLRPWKDHLSVTAEPILTRYFSHGTDYRHCHSIFRIGWSVDFSYGHWLAYANIMAGPENKMYGEEIIEEKDMNQIMVGYKRNSWSVHLGVFNAFMRNYWMETRNLSALAPYNSKAYSARSSSYLAVRFSLSLDFGRQGRPIELPENVSDNDSGILTGNK